MFSIFSLCSAPVFSKQKHVKLSWHQNISLKSCWSLFRVLHPIGLPLVVCWFYHKHAPTFSQVQLVSLRLPSAPVTGSSPHTDNQPPRGPGDVLAPYKGRPEAGADFCPRYLVWAAGVIMDLAWSFTVSNQYQSRLFGLCVVALSHQTASQMSMYINGCFLLGVCLILFKKNDTE